MATSAAAALLDELMGRARNLDPNEKPPEIHWNDPEVSNLLLIFPVLHFVHSISFMFCLFFVL